MKANIRILISIIIVVALVLVGYISLKDDKTIDLSYTINQLNNSFVENNKENIVVANNELENPSSNIEYKKLKIEELDMNLEVFHTIINPLESYSEGVGMSFKLNDCSEEVKVIVLRENMTIVGEYDTEVNQVNIESTNGSYLFYNYTAKLNNLGSGQMYYYLIAADHNYSKLNSFKTMSEDKAITIAFFGDTQGYLNSQYEALRNTYMVANERALVNKLLDNEDSIAADNRPDTGKNSFQSQSGIDLTYIAGDLVDDGGSYDQWQYFYSYMEDVLANKQFISAIGNHDVYNGPDLYVNAFNYPSNGVEGLEQRSFYVDLPYARVAVFDTESTSMFQEQADWLVEVMADSTQPFKIVLMHRSVYPMAYNESHIRQLAGLFELANIDLVLSGHDHIYNRTTMVEETLVETGSGVTYIVGGSSTGSKFYEAYDLSNRYWKHIVYDENHPVFTLINIDQDVIDIKAYSIIDEESVLIDELQLSNE